MSFTFTMQSLGSEGRLERLIEELVTANRVLAHEGVVDSFGHITVRHPDLADRYLMSRARALKDQPR